MKERLLKIIAAEGLTPTLLADKMGVQRSGISHILSGRNYPSFDFLQKLLILFPRLNAEWLILGQGSMYKTTDVEIPDMFTTHETVKKTQVSPTIPENLQNLSSTESNKNKLPEYKPEILPPAEAKKTIEKIVMFYSDKTFTAYSSDKSLFMSS